MLQHSIQIAALSAAKGQHLLFADLNLNLQPGDLLLIEGANGVGKTTLLRTLAGLSLPNSGDVKWGMQSIFHNDSLYQENTHYIGHANGLKMGLTVSENLTLLLHLAAHAPTDEIVTVAAQLHLKRKLHLPTYALSQGQKRRLALAKLFLIPKPIWILDEPFTALDKTTQHVFLDALAKHLMAGGIAILSTHHPIQFSTQSIIRLHLAMLHG